MPVKINIDAKRAELARLGLTFGGGVKALSLHPDTTFEAPCHISSGFHAGVPSKIGAFTLLNGGQLANVEIGRYCSIAKGVDIGSAGHPTDRFTSSTISFHSKFMEWRAFAERETGRPQRMKVAAFEDRPRTIIGNDVWIGHGAFIRAGVTIGDGAIIAAMACVVEDVAPYQVVGKVPAKRLKDRFPEQIARRLQALSWWNYAATEFSGVDHSDIENTIAWMEKALPGMEPYTGRAYSAQTLLDFTHPGGGTPARLLG